MLKESNDEREEKERERQLASQEEERGLANKGILVTGKSKNFFKAFEANHPIADQGSEVSHTKKWPKQSPQQLEFDLTITLWLVMSNIPFNHVETAGFKMMMNYLCPRANIKSRMTFGTHKLKMVYKNIRKDVDHLLGKDLKKCTHVGLTSDTWTARNNEPFMSLTMHYITKDFKIQNISLGCDLFDAKHDGNFF